MKKKFKLSSKRLVVTILITTLLTCLVIIGFIYIFTPLEPFTKDLSNFFNQLPETKLIPNQDSTPSIIQPKTSTLKPTSTNNLRQASTDLDNLNIDGFDTNLKQNDQDMQSF